MLLAALLAAVLAPLQNSASTNPTDVDPLDQRWVDGAIAPPGCWYTRGGCASHSGVSRSAPIREKPTVAWKYASDGEIVGEPIVWKSQIVLDVLRKDGRRQLEVVDVSDGHRVATSPAYETPAPLAPSIWGWRIVARTGPQRLEGLRVNGRTLSNVWKCEGLGPFSMPMLFGGDVWVHARGQLARIPFGRKKPAFAVGGTCRGEIALYGDSVYAFLDGEQSTGISVDRSTGQLKKLGFAGTEANPSWAAPGPYVMVMSDGRVVIQRDGRLSLEGGTVADTAILARASAEPAWLANVVPAVWGTNLLGFSTPPDDLESKALVWQRPGSGEPDESEGPAKGKKPRRGAPEVETIVLAESDMHGEFVANPVSPSLAGNVAYVGGSAFDLQSMRILYTTPIASRFRAVPVAEGVLLVDGPSSLTLLSSASRTQVPGTLIVDFSKPEADGRVHVRGATAVWRDGSIQTGATKVSKEKGIAFASGERPTPKEGGWDDVALLLDSKRNILYAAPGDTGVEAMRLVIEEDMAKRWTDLAVEAGASRDPVLMDRILGKARQLGSTDTRLERAQEMQERAEKEAQAIDKTKQKAIEDKERALARLPAQWMAERAKNAAADAPAVLRATFAAAALEDDRESAAARELLVSLLPDGLKDVPVEAALDVLEAGQATPIRAVDPGDSQDSDSRKLLKARKKWRLDLRGMRSTNLLIVTPETRVGIAARCLETGELVCRALKEIFPPREDADEPLLLYLYETRDEYMQALESGGKAGGIARFSAGVYDTRANITRIFLPDDAESLRSLLSVYAHEMTHHWLSARWGAVEDDDRRENHVENPSFWIVEGLATMIEEFSFDTRAGTWTTTSEGSERVDILANRPPKLAELDWEKFFGYTQLQLNMLDGKTSVGRLRKRDHLGLVDVLTRPYFFYCQAAATCHFLYNAENGAYRDKLLAFAANWYTGKVDALDIEASFGHSPEELGRKIEEWSKQTAGAGTR